MVDLSTADAEKWSPLLSFALTAKNELEMPDSGRDPQEASTIQQRQIRLELAQRKQLVERYQSGVTVYELAEAFCCNRTTVSKVLKRLGVTLRMKPLTTEQIDEAVTLYEQGLSLARVGEQIGASARTIQLRLRERGIAMRDTHGRKR